MQLIYNHKANLTKEEIIKYEKKLRKYNVIVLPSTCFLPFFNKGKYILGSQDISEFEENNRTGEINGKSLKSLNVKYCLVGHSERRIHNKETNESLINKLNNCKKYDIIPLYCIGEKNNISELNEQIDLYLNNVNTNKVHIIYEPVKNIGSNEINIEEIKNNINYITTYIKEKYNKDVNLIYGGGVNINNIEQLKNIKEIDGLILSRDALDINNLDKIYKITNS